MTNHYSCRRSQSVYVFHRRITIIKLHLFYNIYLGNIRRTSILNKFNPVYYAHIAFFFQILLNSLTYYVTFVRSMFWTIYILRIKNPVDCQRYVVKSKFHVKYTLIKILRKIVWVWRQSVLSPQNKTNRTKKKQIPITKRSENRNI